MADYADYIDRTALLAELELNDYPWTDFDDAYRAIQKMPAADVAPVVHGRWVNVLLHRETPIRMDAICALCSNCKKQAARTAFCPNCGAKMDQAGPPK